MPDDITHPQTLSTLKIGDKVRLLSSIYDDGEDHHPPGYIADMGDIVVVRNILLGRIAVSHEEILDNSFLIYPGEYASYCDSDDISHS